MEERPKLKDIPLEEIEVGLSQARIRNVEKNMDVLLRSIKQRGLLQPITVFKNNGKYEIVIGQRRLLAFKKLGYNTIPCIVVKSYDDVFEAKMDSITENVIREDMQLQDKIVLCTELYHKYGGVKLVADELGWPLSMVAKYVKIERLPRILQVEVKEGRLDLEVALSTVDSMSLDTQGNIDNERALQLGLEIQRLNPQQRTMAYSVIVSHPTQSVEYIVEKAKDVKPYEEITIMFLRDELKRVKKFVKDFQKDSLEIGLIDLLNEGLEKYGY